MADDAPGKRPEKDGKKGYRRQEKLPGNTKMNFV